MHCQHDSLMPWTQGGCRGAGPGERVRDSPLKAFTSNQAARRQIRELLPLFNIPYKDIWMCVHVHVFVGWRIFFFHWNRGFPGGASGKEPTCQCQRHKAWGFDPWVGKIPWTKAGQPTAVFLPGESHGRRNMVGHSPLCCKVRHDWVI